MDSSKAKSFYEFDPELESLVKDYRQGINLNNSTLGFSTNELNIKNIFEDKFSKNMILRCVFGKEFSQLLPKINSPIYTKENAAIFEISTISSLGVYSCRISNGVVHINWWGGTIE